MRVRCLLLAALVAAPLAAAPPAAPPAAPSPAAPVASPPVAETARPAATTECPPEEARAAGEGRDAATPQSRAYNQNSCRSNTTKRPPPVGAPAPAAKDDERARGE